MGLNQLCRKCTLLLTRGHLLLLNPPNGGPRYMLMNRVCLFLDNDDNANESERRFRLQKSTEDIVGCIANKPLVGSVDTSIYTHQVLLHHNLEELKGSVIEGCHLCHKFYERFDKRAKDLFSGPERRIRCVPCFIHGDLLPLKAQSSMPDRLMHLEFSTMSGNELMALYIQEDASDPHYGHWTQSLRMLDEVDTPMQSPAPMSQFSAGIRPDTLVRIKSWLRECQNHTLCSHGTGSDHPVAIDLPARLIRIFHTDVGPRLELVETRNIDVDTTRLEYATLSHCWGKTPIKVRLLHNTLKAYLSEIPYNTLPRTFREAVDVAMMLDIEYLWVDAMCIIQDSPSDWEAEAPRMRAIYSGGSFNIAAVCSEDSEGGLFCQDNLQTGIDMTITWTGAYPKNGRTRIGGSSNYWYCIMSSTLASRGWVFQERLLSRCMIYFASDQIWWECRSERHTEFMGLEIPSSEGFKIANVDLFDLFESGKWTDLVAEYTKCKLTRRSDKLVAISGIAELFAIRHGLDPKQYTNGLWKHSLPHDLLWRCNRLSNEFSEQEKAWLAGERDAPSWSWASVEPWVIWREQEKRSKPAPGVTSKTFCHERFVVLDDLVMHSTSDTPFRGTRDGKLYLKTIVHPITFSEPAEQNMSLFQHMVLSGVGYKWDRHCYDSASTKTTDIVFQLHPDFETSTIRDLPATYFLPMIQRVNDGPEVQYTEKQRFSGLVVTAASGGKKGTYTRVGVLEVNVADSSIPTWWSAGHQLDESLYLEEYDGMTYMIAIE